jgi:predicted glycoside hydrolase/deacetylase ChbG (UPF0249 family)
MTRYLIINADDFGASTGINRGIAEAHTRGVVTSTSLMVTGRAAAEAAAMSRDLPRLGIGLHWDVLGEDERQFDLTDAGAVRDEFLRQLDRFHGLLGRMPTHVDSHKHVHRGAHVMRVVRPLVETLGVPLRHDGPVSFIGGFYAQWEHLITDLHHVSVAFLEQLLRTEVTAEWTEIGCHPGYRSDDFTSVYLVEREHELRTLCDPRVRRTIDELGLTLANYADRAQLRAIAARPEAEPWG